MSCGFIWRTSPQIGTLFMRANLLLPAVEQSCFSQVVHLECGETNGEVLLNALAFMPKIETLHVHIIEDLPDIPIFSPTNIVFLPHLHHVRITTDTVWQVGLTILISLRPCPGFQLEFDVRDYGGDISIEDANFITGVLSPFLTNTPWHSAEENNLDIKLYDSMLAIDTRPAQFRLDFFSSDSISELTSILSIPHAMFLKATKLDIDIKGPDNDFVYENNVVQFLSSLAVAHSLRTDMGTLEYIHQLSSRYHDRHLLPSLRHLELHYYEVEFASALEEFLDYRCYAYGAPIQSITCHGLRGRNLTNLERFDGIVFRGYFINEEVHYVCGSGSPETLDFTATAIVKPDPAIARKSILEMLESMRTEPESDEEESDEEESDDEE
ncbi:hypothetical protein D9613_006501 [Agrocybe pediades]|uniref:Uncharacterized protein n=1 Tax=Agrocybe pediades TaxID=84607 RepID=A0A8H4VIM2_9AGAR|nr:hypothetical protein D9613_006501 [Agrocybe pediades]